jgi:uncharacterized protein (DUF2236 family)
MTVAERINAERIVLAGWSRAILLQLAHPLVAQGVADHSTFRAGLFTAAVRLHHTVQAMRHLTFGGDARARHALDGILAIHRRVHGSLREAVGPYPAGTRYSAEDPDLVLWVHATLLDSLPLVYAELVHPLSGPDLDAWCLESASVARALGARDDVPTSWASLQAYFTRMLSGGKVIVGDTARALAGDVLSPRHAGLIAPVRALNRVVTLGLLPPGVREQYGFAWGPRDERRLTQAIRLLHTCRRLTPTVLAHWPDARARRQDID